MANIYRLRTSATFNNSGGTSNYEVLSNKPKINNVELNGNKSSSDLGLQPAGNYLTEVPSDYKTKAQNDELYQPKGSYLTTESDPIFSASAAALIETTDITNWNGKVDTNVNNLTNYTLATATGSTIELNINSSTYVMTLNLKNSAGTTISTGTIDLPLESVVVSGSYDDTTKKIILTLQGGSTVEFSVADLVSGLQSEITSSNKLSSDLVNDTNNTNKFVSSTDKTNWNAKYDKPSGGIPSTDLASAVQTSLGKADTAIQNTNYANSSTGGVIKVGDSYGTGINNGFIYATNIDYTTYGTKGNGIFIGKGTLENVLTGKGYTTNVGTITGITMNGVSKGTSGVVDLGTVITQHQDISGKEDTSNKVTSLSASSTDTQYPSAKCVYDMIGNVESVLTTLTTGGGVS